MEPDGPELSSDVDYSLEYFQKVETITGSFPRTIGLDLEARPWWGNPSDEREQEWNSKLTSFEIASELNLLPSSSRIIRDQSELSAYFKEGMVIKTPYSFSGMGFRKKNEGISSFPVIIEPWEQREFDFGIRYDYQTNNITIVENYIDSLGQFKGGRCRPELESTLDRSLLEKIFKKYNEKGVCDSLQIDCYKTSSGIRYLVEANHRRTMGDFIQKVTEIVKSQTVSILLLNQKQSQTFENQFSKFEKLSPEARRFNCYLIEGIERSDIENLLS